MIVVKKVVTLQPILVRIGSNKLRQDVVRLAEQTRLK